MKPLLLGLLLVAGNALADGTVPDCWSKPKMYFAGHYNATVQVSAGKKTQDQVRDALSQGYLATLGVLDLKSGKATMYFAEAKAPAHQKDMTKKELQKAAEAQLQPLTALTGVKLSCSPIFRPTTKPRI